MATVRHYSGVRESISIDLILSVRAVKVRDREKLEKAIKKLFKEAEPIASQTYVLFL